MPPSSPASVPRTPSRAIALLSVAGFASLSMVRVSDTLLPQIATDVGTTVGAASIVVTAYAITHGSVQLFIGPVGDRFGNYRTVATACACAAVCVLMCGLAQSLPWLALARLASGATAAWIIPLSMAFIGDVTPYERRQQVLARYLSGQISGLLFGQAAGGVLGDFLGWRAVFFLFAGLFAVAATCLFVEFALNPLTRGGRPPEQQSRGFVADYRLVLGNRWAWIILLVVLIEGAFTFGPLTYLGADLHARFGLSFAAVGLIVAAFGAGGLLYVLCSNRLVARLGQRGLVAAGGLLLAAAYLLLALSTTWWLAPFGAAAIGLGYYMLHNTLQTNATQMSPGARGTAVAVFSSALYLGQTLGVAVGAPVFDHYGAPAIFLAAALVMPGLGLWFARQLKRRAD